VYEIKVAKKTREKYAHGNTRKNITGGLLEEW
jgi:hypothetical protein